MKDENMSELKNIPEFEDKDHYIIWKQANENSTAIEVLKEDMDWVKRLLIFVIIPLIIAILTAVIGLGT